MSSVYISPWIVTSVKLELPTTMVFFYASDLDNKNDTLPINLELTLTALIQNTDTDNETLSKV